MFSGTYESEASGDGILVLGYCLDRNQINHKILTDSNEPDEISMSYKFPNNCINIYKKFLVELFVSGKTKESVDSITEKVNNLVQFDFIGHCSVS